MGFAFREAAYREAIEKRRLVAMPPTLMAIQSSSGSFSSAAYFRNARIQQIVVTGQHRRARIASALINEVVSQLQARGYLTITAAVASDLPEAQAFYEHNGFLWLVVRIQADRLVIAQSFCERETSQPKAYFRYWSRRTLPRKAP